MPPFKPLSVGDMLALKRELNFLFWTDAPAPKVQTDIERRVGCASGRAAVDMQCVAHAAVTSILMFRRGYRITVRGGAAYVCDIDPNRPMSEDLMNMITKHWWLTANDELVDLSLYAESGNPLIFRNSHIGQLWQVKHKDANHDWQKQIAAFQTNRTRGVLYVTEVKKEASAETCEHDANEFFTEAEQRGSPITFGEIVTHCESLLANMTPSLTSMSQINAWKTLCSN